MKTNCQLLTVLLTAFFFFSFASLPFGFATPSVHRTFDLTFVKCCSAHVKSQNEAKELRRFDQIRISPLIEVVLEEGEKESITIIESKVSKRNLVYEVSGGTLEVFLRGAKVFPRDNYIREEKKDNYYMRVQEKQAIVKITYRHLDKLTVKGDENITFNTPWNGQRLTLKAYGDNVITIPSVEAETMKVALYGDNELTISGGKINKQYFKLYGDSQVDVQAIEGYTAIANVFGDNELQVNAQDELRIFGFGDFDIQVKGNPLIRKSISMGDFDIEKVD